MDRVLKRVGLSRRLQLDVKLQETTNCADDNNIKIRRRRRSKSRRHSCQDNKKTRGGLFSIDWEFVKDCKSCKSRAITKRFCNKKCENELYRSNSFKFERFVRGNDEALTLRRKISLCDDYSLPVDDLNKKRPNSIAVPSLSEWNISSPNEDKVEVLKTYSTPRDSMQQLVQLQDDIEPKYFTSPDKEYSQPYTAEGSSELSSDDDDLFGCRIPSTNVQELNSPDSISNAILPQVNGQSPNQLDIKRHPSPYYYADLYKAKQNNNDSNASSNKPAVVIIKHKKNHNPDKQKRHQKSVDNKKTKQLTNHSKQEINRLSSNNTKKYKKSASLDNSHSDNKYIRNHHRCRNNSRYDNKSSSGDTQSTDSKDAIHHIKNSSCVMPPNLPNCCRINSDELIDDMTRQKHVYETAFDCQISKSDDDLDSIDKISNHFILVQINNTKQQNQPPSTSNDNNITSSRPKTNFNKQSQEDNKYTTAVISQKLQDMHLPAETVSSGSGTVSIPPLQDFTPTPPSTAPLPTKFHGNKELMMMNSTRSAPNIQSHPRTRHKDLHLPVKSLRGRLSNSSIYSLQTREIDSNLICPMAEHSTDLIIRPTLEECLKSDKPTRLFQNWPKPSELLSLKRYNKEHGKHSTTTDNRGGRRRRPKYSSTESMTTSSSGGSMESIKSSTSEGNRSTTSSDSRQSSSLSSHSSDSGGGNLNFTSAQSSNSFLSHSTKLHILSPISDKSSQEPISETSDNNRNNNSQKCSPDEIIIATTTVTTTTPDNNVKIINTKQRKLPQNKNLSNLCFRSGGGDGENQGSDSGISIQSRDGGIKSALGFSTNVELSGPSQQDFSNLPFDMPKLRRRRMLPQDPCTSSSATSMDFRDLPFDMPKLRRRLRNQQSNIEASVSQASSSQSVIEISRPEASFPPKLTLHLGEFSMHQRPNLELSLMGVQRSTLSGNGSTDNRNPADSIDTTLPLEKQGWFHGAITRVEAENVLRVLQEGSFLVRNSESTKQDYSLSLKSTRGFLHMRIQKDGSGDCYILGQFSKPFHSIPEMIRHFCINRLPIRGAEHMCLLQPVIAQLL